MRHPYHGKLSKMPIGPIFRWWRQMLPNTVKNFASGIVVLVVLVGGFLGGPLLMPNQPDNNSDHKKNVSESAIRFEVTLPSQKVESAGIHIAKVKLVDLQKTKTVAATIDYDSTRRLSVKAPVECVVERWQVKPGQVVSKGSLLAVLSGAEVALARAEIKKREAEIRIAQIGFDWSKETQDNLTELLATLKKEPTVDEVEEKFRGKMLGDHRDQLLTTYTELILASNVVKRTALLGEQGVVAGSTAEARLSKRDVAAIAFKTACEQSSFNGRRDLAKSRSVLELAQRQLAVAQERLRLLLGPLADESTTGAPGHFELRAPFEGRIEVLHTSYASRLAQGEPILTLADTTKLWVSALIHQHDWDALQLATMETVRVMVPAIPDEEFKAKVSFIGPEVSPTTRALSLVAELDNKKGRFRPGMFAWVALPMELAHKGLVVPTSAIQRHESKPFVFVKLGQAHFRRVDVVTGIETREYVEIVQGLSAAQEIVDQGAFYLKSELLLEQEEE